MEIAEILAKNAFSKLDKNYTGKISVMKIVFLGFYADLNCNLNIGIGYDSKLSFFIKKLRKLKNLITTTCDLDALVV